MANISQTSTVVDVASRVILDVNCTSSTQIGDWVYNNSGIYTPAIATSMVTSRVIGIITEKLGPTVARVRVSGVSEAIFTALLVNTPYFLSAVTAGQMTNVIPTTSGHILLNLGEVFSPTEFTIQIKSHIRRS